MLERWVLRRRYRRHERDHRHDRTGCKSVRCGLGVCWSVHELVVRGREWDLEEGTGAED